MEQNRKTLLIYNPRAGRNGKRPKLSQIVAMAEQALGALDVRVTQYAGHAQKIVEEAGRGSEIVVCCGGDGTLNEVVCGLLRCGSRAKICYLPIGSTNDLAKNIGVPADFAEILRLVRNDTTNTYDIATFNDRHFNYIASFGPGVSVSYATPQKLKNAIGYSAYMINGFLFQVIPTLRQVRPKHIRIEYDGKVLEDDFYFGAVSNALSAAGLFKFDRNDVKFNDGRFEVILVRKLKSPLQIFHLLKKVGRHDYTGENLMYFKASKLKLEFTSPEAWTLDGEYGGKLQNVEIEVLNNAIEIFSEPNDCFYPKEELVISLPSHP